MFYYTITITDNKGKRYVGEIGVNGFPIETPNRKSAYRFAKSIDAHRYANSLNSNLQFCYKQNKVSEENQYYYKVESMSDDKYQFYLSVLVEGENNENEILLDVDRKPYFGSMDDAIDECREMMRGVNGVLREGKIESLKEGIATIGFVDEYRFKPFYHTNTY